MTSLSPSTTLQRPFALTGYTFGAFTPAFAMPTLLVLAATGHAARTLAWFTPSSFRFPAFRSSATRPMLVPVR